MPHYKRLLTLVFTFLLPHFAEAVPTISTRTPAPAATVSSLTTISVTFNEAVTGVDADDLLINSNGALLVTGLGAGPYVFTFTQPLPGTVDIAFDGDHGISGQAGTGAFAGASWACTLNDTIPPTVALIAPAATATVGALSQVEVTFNEAVTGVDAADLTINGSPAAAVTGGGFGPYVFTFPQPIPGSVNFAWAVAHGIVDTAAVPNAFAGGSWTVTLSATGIGNVVINEFLAANGVGLADENVENSDWIELFNAGTVAVNLVGWALTNDVDDPGQWVFPSRTIAPGAYLVVFASGKNRKPASGNLHTNFQLNENGGYLALSGPDSPRAVFSQFPPNYNPNATPPVTEYPEQRTDYSYGPQTGGALRYFSPPKPNLANGVSTLTAITARVNASVGRGYFQDAFQLVLSCPDASATIRYTTDFSEPTATTGILYSGPITISTTKCLRAVAFSATKIPSLPVTHSYIYLDQVLPQPNTPAGFPTNWGAHASFPGGVVPADYEVDSDPLRVDPNNGASAIDPVKLQRFKDGMRELPLLSVTIPMADMFNPTGMYSTPNVTNKNFGYKKCAVEMVLPDGSTAFSEICGISGHGNASRDPLKNPKHGFQLKFKGDYGAGSLNYKLYPDSPVEEFDDIILRPDFNSSWRHWSDDNTNGAGLFQRTRATRLHDAFLKNTFRDMGGPASYHRFFHLFINGLYWGTYDFAEQPVDGFGKAYLGGDKLDYDVIHEGVARAGAATIYNTMTGLPTTTTNALYETMKGYLDVTEHIDYTLLHFFNGHQDWGNIKNWYAIRRRSSATNPTEGKFQYIPWDQECTLLETTVNRVANADVASGLHTKLVSHAQYRLDFADRVHRHMISPVGALTPAANIARWQKWQAVMDKPIVGESVRWGDYRRDVHNYQTGTYVLYTRENQWLAENTRKTGTYFAAAGRPATVLSQLQTGGLYPTLLAPQFRQNTTTGTIIGTGTLSAGSIVAMNRPGNAGTIHFTTDGNDPHIYYTPTTGATAASVAPTAQAYTAPITITETTTIKSRILNSGVWSALNEATFTVGLAASPIRITEIMYNPPTANGGASAEFIELQNTGSETVDMAGWHMTGVDFVFPFGFTIGAGARVVIGSNNAPAVFTAQYPGVATVGYFGGSLDNNGERLALRDATGRTMVAVEYDDTNPWPTTPDGGGYSLEIIAANGDPNDPFNWKASAALKGTPGIANSTPGAQSVELSEVGAAGEGFIELRNKTGSPIPIGGWQIRGSITAAIPGGTMLAADGFYTHLATLPQDEGSIGIYTEATLATRVDGVVWGNQIAGASIGRVSGAWMLCERTPGAANTSTPTAPAANLAINEWLANSAPGASDWIELFNKHATLPVALRGVFVQTATQLFQVNALAFVAPLGWVQMLADEMPGGSHLDLKLDATGTSVSLRDGANAVLDSVTFGAQAQSVAAGRLPDGATTIVAFPGTASPGAANYVSGGYSGPVLNEILARNVAGDLAPWGNRSDWIELVNPGASDFNAGGIKIGPSGNAGAAWTIPAGTNIPAGGVIAIWCESLQPASTAASPTLNTGFVLDEVSGAVFLFDAAGRIVDSIQWGFQIPDRSIGRDSGVWKLLAATTRGVANSAAAALGATAQLRINEWAASLNAQADWFELHNLDPLPVAMAGLYLTDDPSELGRAKFQIAALSFIDGGKWVKWEADGAPELGRNHVNFTLDGGAEYLRISNNNASFTAIDVVSFGVQSATATQGRILDGQTIQSGLVPTPGARNILPPAPFFTTHPTVQAAPQGGSASFTVAATGSAPLTFQWKFNGDDLPGMTSATLALSGVGTAHDGLYTCIATNTAGSVTSNGATLIVQSTFAQWAAARGVTGVNGDSDSDGIGNLAEFFHNLDPLTTANATDRAALPQFAIEPPTGTPLFLTLTYRVNARAILTSREHQISIPLASDWSTVVPDATENLTPDAVTGDPRVRVKFSIAPGETRKFLRLLLTQ